MQFDVSIRLYEYWHEQVKTRKKRWNNKEIRDEIIKKSRNFIENKFVNRKLPKVKDNFHDVIALPDPLVLV
jgi:non-homologous end joining protein Ku